MVAGMQVDELLKLDVEERLRLIELLWDSLASQPEWVKVTEAQRRVLAERLAEHESAPGDVVSWDDMKARLRLR